MHLSLPQKELFFHDLAQLLRGGQSLRQALELKGRGRAAGPRQVALAMLERAGDSSAEGYFAAVPGVFSELDREIVRGGEVAGRLDDTMGYLAGYYATLARTRRRILAQSAYPVFLLHLGALLLGVPDLMAGGVEVFVWSVAKFLGLFYLAAAAVWLAFLAVLRAAREVPAADRILQAVPVLGGAREALVGSRFCMLMGILVNASGSILSALNRAGSASGSALFRQGTDQVVRAVQGGERLSEAVARTRVFPEAVDRVFQTGEATGRLGEEMALQADRYVEQFQGRARSLAGALGTTIYLAIAGTIAVRIVLFYSSYYSGMSGLLE
jgi:type II secretory pathway component PulF